MAVHGGGSEGYRAGRRERGGRGGDRRGRGAVRGKRLGKAPFGRFSVMRPTFPSTPAGAAMMYSFPCAVEVVDSVRPDTTALHSAPRPSPTTRPIAAITNVLQIVCPLAAGPALCSFDILHNGEVNVLGPTYSYAYVP
jgi:hypothetical protein